MRQMLPELADRLGDEVTTLAWLVRVEREDGLVLGFSTHDRDVSRDGVLYQAAAAMSPSAVEQRVDLAVDSLELVGLLEDERITEGDLRAGLYDGARVELLLCDWADASVGTALLARFVIGEVRLEGARWVAELLSLKELMQKTQARLYAAECDAALGDDRCGVDLNALEVSGVVAGVADARRFSAVALEGVEAGALAYGLVRFESGANAGRLMEIRAHDAGAGEVELWLPLPDVVSVGDAFTCLPGCDKRFSTCRDRFGNQVNFRGYPFIPGQDRLMEYPDAKG